MEVKTHLISAYVMLLTYQTSKEVKGMQLCTVYCAVTLKKSQLWQHNKQETKTSLCSFSVHSLSISVNLSRLKKEKFQRPWWNVILSLANILFFLMWSNSPNNFLMLWLSSFMTDDKQMVMSWLKWDHRFFLPNISAVWEIVEMKF